MGDTGSLLIGFIISAAVVRIFAAPELALKKLPFYLDNLPLVIMAILVVPLFDTTRVFAIRIMNRQKPFLPDRNHIHHILIDYMKFSHKQASLIIGIFNMFFIVFFVALSTSVNNYMLLIILVISLLLVSLLLYRMNFSISTLRRRLRWKRRVDHLTRMF
jgi:UDP-N-acetylmuramyl pentapeptide phosphotransferase/UDP-N-acetylglucosamine-1-phosphate transferase